VPPAYQRLFTLQSWDTASKGGPENDFSVCTTWIVGKDKKWYLVNVWRGRVDYPGLKERVLSLPSPRSHELAGLPIVVTPLD
jgi:phage terminase large subunit-like protein